MKSINFISKMMNWVKRDQVKHLPSIVSGKRTDNGPITDRQRTDHSFIAFHALRYIAAIAMMLVLSIGEVWGEKGFFDSGQWNIKYWNGGGSDKWGSSESGYNNNSVLDLGVQTSLNLKGSWVKTWSNDNWTQSEVCWYVGFTNESMTYQNKVTKSAVKGDQTWEGFGIDYNLISNAPVNPGPNTVYMYWRLDNYVSTSTSRITFTIPGFTTTSTSQTFDNTLVSGTNDKTISFGTHYGTALTTSNCSITGTNSSEFSVRSINESGVTVRFSPSSAGEKSATLTITDAHSKTCTITLSGKTKHTVTYNTTGKDGGGSAPSDATQYAYNATVTVKDNTGLMTKSNKVFAGWATSSSRATDGNIDYAPSATFSITQNMDLYPVWTDGYYLISLAGAGNTGTKDGANFIAKQSLQNTQYTVNGVTFSKNSYKFSANQTIKDASNQDTAKFIIYDTEKTQTIIRVYLYNKEGSANRLYYNVIKEGTAASSDSYVDVPASSGYLLNIDASSTKRARVVLSTGDYSNLFVTQVIAIEKGSSLPGVGDAGYELTFPGRPYTYSKKGSIDKHKISYEPYENTALGASSSDGIKFQSSGYIEFNIPSATQLKVTTKSGKGFYVCTDKDNASTTGFLTSASGSTYNIYLDAAGKYYIVGETSSNTYIKKIAFAAHTACTAPTGLSAGSTTYNGTTFTVTDGTNANNYEFYVSTSSTAPTASTTPSYTSTSKTLAVDDLNKNTTYYAWVRTNGGYFHKSSWIALTGTTFKTLDAYDITYNCDGAESGCPSATAGIALPNPLPNAPYKPGYVFAGWYTNSAKTVSAVAGASISENTTLYAKWTKVYASGTYQFDGHLTLGSSPSKTVTGSEVSYDAFRVDNIFFSGTKIQFEGTDGTPYGDGDDYKGWKIKASTTIKFFVEDDSDVEVSIGSIGGGSATVTYTNQSGVLQSNTAHTAGTVVTYKADAGTMVTITCSPSSGKSVTLKRIKITATASCYAPTSPSISGTTAYDAGDNISLTASATGTSGSTTYQWYKGDPENGGVSQGAASTSGATYTKNSCVVGDAGTYYCVISNGEGCTVTTSQAITVACLTAPVAVTSLTCSAQTTSSLTYTWTKASNASGYVAKLWDNSSCTGDAVATQNLGDVATVTFSTLSASTTYYCKVQSKGNGTVYCVDGGTTSAVSGTTSTPTYTVSITVNPAGYGSVSASSVSSVTSGTTLSASTNTLSVGATDVTATAADATAEYTYAFSNWTKSDGTALPSTVTADLSVYANFTRTANSYTLTWDLAGGIVTTAGTGAAVDATGTPSSSVAYGTAITAPVVTKSGYDFAGWSSTPAGTMPAANTTYTATWAQKYTVTYNYNGATSGASPASVTAASVTLPTPTRTSYVFDGWYTTAGTKVGDGGDTYNPTADITLYARWEESCAAGGSTTIFAWTKGTGAEISSDQTSLNGNNMGTMTTGTSIEARKLGSNNIKNNADNIDGYKLGNNDVCIEIQGTSNFAVGDVVTITGGSDGSNSRCFCIAPSSATSATSSDTTQTNYSTSTSTEFTAAVTSKQAGAKMRIFRLAGKSVYITGISVTRSGGGGGTCYHVYYHGNGAESGFVSDTTSYANSATATILDFDDSRYPLTKAGYTFQGWATSAGGSVAKTAGQTVTISSADVHYYAVWAVAAPTYDITNGNPSHGTISISDGSSAITEAEEDATVHISATPADGYSFGEWTVTKDASGDPVSVSTSSTANPATFTMPAEAVTVTATFSPNTYDITYHLNGASWASAAGVAEYTVGTGATLPLASAMTNTGYTFAGWKNNSSLTGDTYTSVSTSDYGNKEFWAKWTENTYTVTYDKNGGSGDAMSNTVGHYVTLSDNAYTAPSGKTFVEWNTATDGSGASYNEGEEVELTDDLDLYAIWANDFDVNWTVTKIDSKLYRGGGGYSVKAEIDNASWDAAASDADKLALSATEGVTLRNVTTSINASGKAQIVATFDITTDVDEDATEISFTLSVPDNNGYGAKDDVHNEDLDPCPAGGGYTSFFSMIPTANTCSITNTQAYNASNHYTTCECTSSATITTGGSVTFGFYSSGSGATAKYWEYDSKNGGWKHNLSNSWVVLYSTDPFVAGDSIVITNGNTAGSGYYTIVAAASNNTAEYRSASQVVAPSTTNPAKNTNYYYKLPGSFVSSNYLVIRSATTSACYVGTITAYHAGASGGVATSLTWSGGLADGGQVTKDEGVADFTYTASTTSNTLGAITYTSSDAHVTVSSTGKVHIGSGINFGGADYKDITITANLAESGCYESASITYTLRVNNSCEDVAGTISTENLGCDGIRMTVTGHIATGSVSYQWYQNDEEIDGATNDNYTATSAGEYYVIVTNTGEGHCAMASANTVVIEAQAAATATKIVDEWYVKNGRRTPDIALVQTTNATGFIVKSGSTTIWNSDSTTTTGFGGCGFHMDENGIIYLNGTKDNGDATTDLSAGNETLTFTAKACGGDASKDITIHKQAATDRASVAYVSLGTEKGAVTDTTAGYYKTAPLYIYLDHTLSGGAFDLTARNIYWSVNEQKLREHYSQFDAIVITDDPNTGKKKDGKSYVDAMGALIDIRPMLTMEAWVSGLANWKAKGIDGNPTSPNPRQYAMTLECKDHEIFAGLDPASVNVEVTTEGGIDYWTVTMVDSTKSPYSGVADDSETGDKPALQGFSASDVSGLLLLGEISEGSLYAGVERQEEPAARLMLLGLNAKALPNALTTEGKTVIKNAITYLLKTNMEDVDDCSNYFTGATSTDWNTASNWFKNTVPNSPTTKVRILAPCEVGTGGPFHAASIDIATSGTSGKKAGTCNGSLTIAANGALIVGGKIRSAEAPYFNTGDLKPTAAADLVLNTNASNQAALIFNNNAGDTKATVNLYSKGRKDGSYLFQYFAVPMSSVAVNPTFANETYPGKKLYTYVWQEASGWERRGYYTDLRAFEGLGITTNYNSAMEYTMTGNLASTTTQEIALTHSNAGLNLIGNSWTAPIQISQLLEDNSDSKITKTAYIYCTGNDGGSATSGTTETAGQWLAIPFSAAGFGEWTGLKVIPAMQAFEIKVSGAVTFTLDYNKVVRGDNTTLNAPLRAPKRVDEHNGVTLTNIRVADSKTHTDLALFEGENFTEEFDNGWEAEFMSGDGRSAKLYAETEIGQMAVAALPELEGTILGFAPGKETEYTFSFSGAGKGYYLNDLKLKQSTLIEAENSYSFTFEEGDTNRFYISKTRIDAPAIATGVGDVNGEALKPHKILYNDKLYILYNGRVYDATGKMVK